MPAIKQGALPSPSDPKITFEITSCPEYTVTGVLYDNKKLFLHMELRAKFTKSVYKQGLGTMVDIKQECRRLGIPFIYCLVPQSLVKYERMLGFTPIEEYTSKIPDGEHLFLMQQDTK